MAEIKPFAGYRFALSSPDELGAYVSPPYDMIDNECADALYARGDYNTVRLIQNRPEPDDGANRDRHRRAAALFAQWRRVGRLTKEKAPCLYLYRQRFTAKVRGASEEYVRTGFISRVRLSDFSSGVVLPHEYTLSGPKKDRYELLEEIQCNTGQIFGLVPDEGPLYARLRETPVEAPCGVFTDEQQVTHELYVIEDAASIHAIQEIMRDRTILIADGHHRYETALEYSRANSAPGHDYVMMTLVSMADAGLVIRPFHRLVKRNALSGRFDSVDDLRPFFSVENTGPADEQKVWDYLRGQGDWEMLFLDSRSRNVYGLKATSEGEAFIAAHAQGMSPQWNALNVSRINRLCVQGVMQQPADGAILHEVMDFVNDARQAFTKAMGNPRYAGIFFLRPIPMDTVRDIVSHGERMPQKSTNFYPKLFSGLVFNKLEDE